MTIYTRHGDKAQTTTFDGDRVLKTSPTINAYGDIDELTSHLGLLKALMAQAQDKDTHNDSMADEQTYIEHLQRHLLAVGWCLMSNRSTAEVSFTDLTKEMEQRIDLINAKLPPLHTFVIPGNTVAEERNINPQVLAFINRLSDYLFVLARKLNFITHQEEKRWNKS